MFNLREFILNNLIKGVKNGTFTKEYASILATNYLLKGILTEDDIQRFDEETKEPEPVEPEEVEEVEETEATESEEAE